MDSFSSGRISVGRSEGVCEHLAPAADVIDWPDLKLSTLAITLTQSFAIGIVERVEKLGYKCV